MPTKERRQVELLADDVSMPAIVKLHGLLPAPRVPPVNPEHRRCGVGYYTDTQEKVWLPLRGLKRSVCRAEFFAVVRALEECQPHETVSDCKAVVKAVQALQTGRRQPRGRNTDLEKKDFQTLLPGQRIRVTAKDHYGNGPAGVLANQGIAEHGLLDSEATWTMWAYAKVLHVWRLVGPQLRERPDSRNGGSVSIEELCATRLFGTASTAGDRLAKLRGSTTSLTLSVKIAKSRLNLIVF
eukprot:5893727-Amphidinium_carterae.1